MKLVGLFKEYWRAWSHHPRERGKLALGCVFFPRATHEWLSYVDKDAHLKNLVREHPKLATRIYRPYALRSLNCSQRVAHIIQHHDILRGAGWSALTAASTRRPLHLISWPSKEGDNISVELVSLIGGHREGESHLQMVWNGHWLLTLTFLIRERSGARELLVTRLQGSQDPSATDWIRSATKALHGLRPADLLVQLAQHLAQILGCHRVLLVSNEQRVALNPARRMRIKSDLDRLWRERGAQHTREGLYLLEPQVLVRSDFSQVVSSKRAQAKRRSEVLLQALSAVDDVVRGLRMRPAVRMQEH